MEDTKRTTEEQLQHMKTEIDRLSKLVYFDELTGLLNRRGFLEEAERIFHMVSQGQTTMERRTGFQIPFAVIFADIDNFKSINDRYGHDAGDAALRIFARTLQHGMRAGDLLGRLGGEEFVAALVGAGATLAADVAEKLRHMVEQTRFEHQGTHIPLTASFGVAEYGVQATLMELIGRADRAMYQAKQAGKNRVVVSDQSLRSSERSRSGR